MRKITTTLLVILLHALYNQLNAQQLIIKDFVLFGKEKVQLSSSSTIIDGGKVGSNFLIKSTGTSSITSSLHSGNKIELANSNTVIGNITAANSGIHNSTSISIGSNASISGSLDANGNITINSGTVNGPIVTSGSYSGPQPTSGSVTQNGQPTIPVLPQLPSLLVPAKYDVVNSDIKNTTTITPGAYKNMTLTGNKTVTFSGPGDYVFESILNSGNFNKFVFDFKGNANGTFRIFVTGNVDLHKILIEQKNLPIDNATSSDIAARVLMQVSGTGGSNGYAWSISNGASSSNQSNWFGTVIAPNGSINVGSGSSLSKIIGGLWSSETINIESGVSITFVPLICSASFADAGEDKTITCPATETSIGTTNSEGTSYKWTTIIDGVETEVGTQKIISVNKAGTYKLAVSNNCGIATFDEVIVKYVSCVEPINETPGGKVENLIGSELTNLNDEEKLEEAIKHIVILGTNYDSVLIEAVAIKGYEQEARDLLWSYGLRDTIPNGINPLLITGVYPIANLLLLTEPEAALYINEVRPVYLPYGNIGLVTSIGDISVGANLVREGFNVSGDGIKIGIISDSYNTLNAASTDVSNGDLPGDGNPDGNITPVQVLQEFPWGRRSDEGRAMAQIIHDLAPTATLAFRTGFISAGDFANGILQLKDAGCKVIVDDVTYITEPFFQDGTVSKAVDIVTSQGVSYFTSAGNFGSKSYTSSFNPTTVSGISGLVHNFSGGDIRQKVKLKSGTYTIVLQWQDDIYSLGNSTSGALNDFDIYLVDPGGSIGFNRNNIGGDPLEVLSFSINLPDTSQVVEADLMIIKAGSAPGALTNPLIKYIIFRGNATIDEYYSEQPLTNKSTIVGQANSAHAISVGAVLYSNTPALGGTPTVASFSSTGGTPIFNGASSVVRAKPELTGPNGVNTTVQMGPDYDGDGFSNFFGTSAAAPHAAAVAALVMQARIKYYEQELTPDALKYILFNSAIPMQPDGIIGGVNFKAGYGLVQADLAIRSFANPTPHINSLSYNSGIIPGQNPFTLTVKGEHLSSGSIIYFRGEPIETVVNDNLTELTGEIPVFTGNPPINVYSPSFDGATNDGGFSNSLYFFTAVRDTVTIIADNKTKLYGEDLPELTTTILLNGDTLEVYNQKNNTNITRADLGVENLTKRYTNADINSLTGIGNYQIRASRSFDSENETDLELLEKYHYDSTFGFLQINKLAITVSPQDMTVNYGDAITNVEFDYIIDPSANISNSTALLDIIKFHHKKFTPDNALAVIKDFSAIQLNGSVLTPEDIDGMNLMLTHQSIKNSRRFQLQNNSLIPAAADNTSFNLYYLIDVASQSLYNYKNDPAIAPFEVPNPEYNGKAIVSQSSLKQNLAKALVNGQLEPLVNGSLVEMIDGNLGSMAPIVNGQLVQLVNGQLVQLVNGQLEPLVNTQLVQLVNGQLVQLVNGEFVSIEDGQLVQLLNGQLLQLVNGQLLQLVNGQLEPLVNGQLVQLVNGEYYHLVNGQLEPLVNGQLVQLVNAQLVQLVNGQLEPLVNTQLLQLVNGQLVQLVNGQLVQLVNGEETVTGFTNKTAVIIDENDVNLQGGWLGAMFGVNMITGLDVGTQKLIPGVLLNQNLEITYKLGTVTVNCAAPESQCTVPTSFTNDVVLSGNKKWSDILPRISPDNITGTIRIRGSGTLTVSNKNLLLKSHKAVLVIEGITLIVDNGNFGLDNSYSRVIIKDASVRVSGNFSQNSYTQLCISNSELEIGDELANGTFSLSGSSTGADFLNNGGYRYLNNVCLNVTKNLQLSSAGNGTVSGGGLDVFVNVYGEIGDEGSKNACTGYDSDDNGSWQNNNRQEIYCSEFHVSDNIQNSSSASMVVKGADLRTLKGNFEQSGTLNGNGLNLAINNEIINSGTWSAEVDMWYAANTSSNLSIGPKANSLQTVLDAKFECGCNLANSKEIITAASGSNTSASVNETKHSGIHIFPNPASNFINISFIPATTGNSTIGLYSIDGRKISEIFNGITEAGKSYNKHFTIADLPFGTYMVRLQEKDKVIVKKIVIVK